MPKRVGLQELRVGVRRRADLENSDFCSDSEIDDYVNSAWCELYDILIQKYSETYFLKSSDVTTVSGTDSYDLPDDFYKVFGVDYKADNNDYIPLKRYRFTQRVRDSSYRRTTADTKYRVQGEEIFFIPTPDSAKTMRIWYIPNPRLIETTSPTVISRSSTTTWTTSPKNFAVGDFVKLYDFSAVTGDYNTVQKITAVGAATITTDFDSTGTSDPTAYGELCSMIDTYSSWDEYILVDAAMRVLVKEESDITPLLTQKNSLLRRIEMAASNRDAGEPQTVTDVSDYDNFYLM